MLAAVIAGIVDLKEGNITGIALVGDAQPRALGI